MLIIDERFAQIPPADVVAHVRAYLNSYFNLHSTDDFIVCFRMSLDSFSNARDNAVSPADLYTIAVEMAATGDIDLLSVTVGDGMTKAPSCG